MFNTKDTLFGKKDEAASGNKPATTPQRTQPPPAFGRSDTPPPSPSPSYFTDATPSAPASVTPAAAAATTGSKLIVGPDIKLKGVEITDCDTLVVEGRVEASMDSRVIQIAEHGVYSGTVGIDVAEIHGCFEGELTARKQLIIHATGRVSGTIRYGKLSIEEGGELSGAISTLSGSGATQSSKSSHPDVLASHESFAQASKASVKPASPTH